MAANVPTVSRSVRSIYTLLVVVLAVPILIFVFFARESRQKALEDAASETRHDVALLHEHALKVFEVHELTLRQVDSLIAGRDWDAIARDETLQRVLRTAVEHSAPITSVWLTDASGMHRLSSQPMPYGAPNVADRDFFRVQQLRDVGTFIGAPLIGRVTGSPAFAASRRRTTPSGQFDGIIHVSVNPEYFIAFWKRLVPGLDPAVALTRADGTILARYPAEVGRGAIRLAPTAPLMRLIGEADEGTGTWRSPVDGSERIVSYKKLAGYPVYVIFGLGRNAVLARWGHSLAWHGVFAAASIVALGLLGVLAVRRARAQAEAEVQAHASETRLRRIIESTTDSVMVLDRAWCLTYVNERAKADIFSRGRDFVGGNLWEIFPEAVGGPFWHCYRRAMVERVEAKVETFYAPLNAWFEAHAYPLEDGITVFFRNISERKRAEDALRQSEERYRLAASAAGCAVWDWNPEMNQVQWAGSMESLFGYGVADIDPTYEWWEERVHPEDREKLRGRIDLARDQREQSWTIEYRFRRADGAYATVQDCVYTLHCRDGSKPVRLIGAMTDITDRKRDDERLRRNAAHLARAQSVAALGSAEVDFRTRRWEWSDQAYRIYGLEKSATSPSYELPASTVHEEDSIRLKASLDALFRASAADPIEYRIVVPSGQTRIIYCEYEFTRDEAGEVIGAMATMRDVTELRAGERQRQDLQNKHLHAQRMEALGTLAGGISHDLNNTLVPVITLSELIRRKLPANHPDGPLLDVMRESGERARDLVRQILTFSRRQRPHRCVLDISSFVIETMCLSRATVPTTIKIEERVEAAEPIFADSGQLHQVILNLVTNAAQAIGDETGTITIELANDEHAMLARRDRTPQSCVRLSISDTGCGMEEATLNRIFEPFFTTKAVGRGTGLGLSVVHGIVAEHGGSIEVTSQPGRGTRFDIFLPAHDSENSELCERGAVA